MNRCTFIRTLTRFRGLLIKEKCFKKYVKLENKWDGKDMGELKGDSGGCIWFMNIEPSIFTPSYISNGNENLYLHRNLYKNVCNSGC